MGMATYIEQSVNNALDHYVVTSSDAVIAVLTPVAVTAVTLYVMWSGFQVARGDVQEPVTALVWRWFRVALITGLTLNGLQYRSLVKEGLDGIQEAFASAFGGVLSMGGTIDQMADPFTTLMETLFTEASSGLVPQFSLFIAGAICATASIVMAFVAMGVFLVAKVSLALLLAVGPAFIFCAMFPVTQRYAENWLSSSLVAVFTNVLIMAVITFLASLLRNACLHVLSVYSTTSILADVVGLLFLSITAAYVLLHVGVGSDHAGEFGDHLHPKRTPVLWRCIQDFRDLVQVPSQGKELLIRSGQCGELRLPHMGLPSQFGADHCDHPGRGLIALVPGAGAQRGEFGGGHIQFDAGGGSFSSPTDAQPRRRSLGRLAIHGLPNGIPQGMARGDAVVLTPGLPRRFQVTEIHCDRRGPFFRRGSRHGIGAYNRFMI